MYYWNNDIRGLLSEPQMPEVRVEAAPIPQAMPQAPQSEGIGIGDVLKGIAYGFVPNTMSAIEQFGQARGARRAAVGQEGAAKYNQLAEYWADKDPEKSKQYLELSQYGKAKPKEAFSREVGINPQTGQPELAVVYRDGTIEWTGVKPQPNAGRAATASAAPGKLPVGMMWEEGSGRAVPIPGVPQKAPAGAPRAGIPMPSEAIAANQKILQQMYGTPPKGMRWNSRGEAMPIPIAGASEGQKPVADEGKVAVVRQALSTIRNLKNAPGLGKAVGFNSAFPTFPGGSAANFETDLEVLKSQTFLPQIEKMRGMGALSDTESKTLKMAVGNLDLRQGQAQFRNRLSEIEAMLIEAEGRMTGKPAKQEPQQPVRRYNPATGRIE